MPRLLLRYLLLLTLLPGLAPAQPLPRLIPYRQGPLWGYADARHRVRIQPAYDDVTFFHRGRARVMRDGKWAYLDSTGRLLTPLTYTWLGYYHQGRAPFERAGRRGYLDPRGREVLLLDSTVRVRAAHYEARNTAWYRKQGRLIEYQALPLHMLASDSAPAPYTSVHDFVQNWAVVPTPGRRGQPPRYRYLNRQGRFLTDSSFRQLERHAGGVLLLNGTTLLDTTGRVRFRRPGVFLKTSSYSPVNYQPHYPELPPGLWLAATQPFDPRNYQQRAALFGLIDARGQEVLAPVYPKIELLRAPLEPEVYGQRQAATLFLVTEASGQQFVFDYLRRARSRSYDQLRPTYVRPLRDFLLVAERELRPQLIDRTDRVLIPPGFTEISLVEENPLAKPSGSGLPPENQFGFVTVRQTRDVGLYDYRGRQLLPPRYRSIFIFSDGVAGAVTPTNVGELYDHTGARLGPAARAAHRRHRLRVECQSNGGVFCSNAADSLRYPLPDSLRGNLVYRVGLEGRFQVILYEQLRDKERTNEFWSGVLDTTGRVVVPIRRWQVSSLRPGYYLVKSPDGRRQWLYGPQGKPIITSPPPDSLYDYETFSIERLGRVFRAQQGQRSVVYDSTGRVIDPVPRGLTRLPDLARPERTAPAYAAGGKYGMALFDQQGRPLTGFDYADPARHSYEQPRDAGLLWVQTTGKWGFVDARGRPRIGFQFEGARSFHEGRAAVNVAGRWGFIDTTGTLVIQARYDSVSDFDSGRALTIRPGRRYEYIDPQGRPVLADQLVMRYAIRNNPTGQKPTADEQAARTASGQRVYHEIYPFHNGRALVRLHMRFGYIDPSGREVIPVRYYYPSPFTGELAWVRLDQQILLLDRNGKVVDEARVASGLNGFQRGLSVVGSDYTPADKQTYPVRDLGDPNARTAGYLYWLRSIGKRRPEYQLYRLHDDVANPSSIITQNWKGHDDLPTEAGLGEPAVRLLAEHDERPGTSPRDSLWSTRMHALADGRLLHAYPGQVVAPFRQGLARAYHARVLPRDTGRQPAQHAVGFIRPDGQVVIPYQYQHAGELAEGLIPVQQPRQAGYLGPDGRPFFSE